MRLAALGLALFAATSVTACAEVEEVEEDVEVLGKGDGVTSGFLGTYAVTTPISFHDLAVVPVLGPSLVELRRVRQQPGEAVLDAIAAADLGLLSTTIRHLPASARAQIVARVNPILEPVKDEIADLAADLEKLVATVEIHSEIRITERGRTFGITKEQHAITGLVFQLNGLKATVPVANVMDSGHGHISRDGEMSLDDVDLELPIGALLLPVAERHVFPRFGARDLHEALELLIDCDRIGAEIEQVVSFVDGAGKCHEALATLEDTIRTGLVIELEVRDGTGTIKNGTIENGAWTWTLQLGGAALELPLKFTARRR